MRFVPVVLFVGLTSALIGGAIGASQDSAAAGLAAGVFSCVLLTAITALVFALGRERRITGFHVAVRVLVVLNAVALAISIVLVILTNGTVQTVSVVSAGVSVLTLLFIVRRDGTAGNSASH
jgi:hypothetical protein